MSEQGAALQSYNNELVKYIEHLKQQRVELNDLIIRDEEQRAQLIKEVSLLEQKLHDLDATIEERTRRRDECDKILEESEVGLQRIIESSKLLLGIVQKQTSANNNKHESV